MARPLRIEYDGAVYHVTSRGNARKPIYRSDTDREGFLDVLHKVNERFNWLCHAYCLMNNHYHLIIETPDGNLSKGMRQLNGVYTQLFNRLHHRIGHVFQGRYKAIIIQRDSHLLEVCRYVVLNPVRAKAVARPEEWQWSSYRGMAGFEKTHPSVTTDWVLGQFGSIQNEAKRRYREFVHNGIGTLDVWKEVRGQSLLGEESFVEDLLEYVKGHREIKEIPKSQRYADRPTLEKLFASDIVRNKKKRDKRIIEAVEKFGYSQREIAENLDMHYTTISRIVNERSC